MIAQLKDRRVVGLGTMQFDFEVLEPFTFKPGQYVVLKLINPPPMDAKGDQRFFSINNTLSQKNLIQITTRLTDSTFKKYLQEAPLGTELEIKNIAGSFVLPEDTSKPLVFIAGGIGVTPYLSMLSFIDEQKLTYNITFLYSNRNKESTAHLEKLEQIAHRNPNIKIIFIMTEEEGWTGEKRKIDRNLIKEYFPKLNDNTFYVVGPPPMVGAVRQALSEIGVADSNIKFENFTGY